MVPGVNYIIYGCFSARTTPGESLYVLYVLVGYSY